MKIRIFHTNDIHGRLDAMPRLASMIRRLRQKSEAEGWITYYWDAGDAADRRFQIFSMTKGQAVAPILHAMGCTLQTAGNAIALPYGPNALAKVAEQAPYPVLAANFRNGENPLLSGLRESVILDLPGGHKLGVFGLTAPWGNLYEVFGLHMPDFLPVARAAVAELKRNGAATVIGLSHLGLEDDRRLAEEVEGIDLIIGAHSHDLLERGETLAGVLIAQAGEYGQCLGIVDLILDDQTGRARSKSAQVRSVPADEPQDPATLQSISQQEVIAEEIKAEVVGKLAADLPLDHFQECPMGNLAADAIRSRYKADAAIISSGLFHQGLKRGPLTRGDLDTACFSSANPCFTFVDGSRIRSALERGLDPGINQFLHHGFRGTPIGVPQISGLRVGFDITLEPGTKVRWVEVDGAPLEPDRLYKLAHTDAETMADYGFLQLPADHPVQHEVPTIIREALEEYLGAHSPVERPAGGRWVNVRKGDQPKSPRTQMV